MIPHFARASPRDYPSPRRALAWPGVEQGAVIEAVRCAPRFTANGEEGEEGSTEGRSGRRAPREALRAGLRFEGKVQDVLSRLLPGYLPGPWFKYRRAEGAGPQWCQPDGIFRGSAATLIVEIKTSHTERAWWQLRHLYQPVVEKAFGLPAVVVEVVRRGDFLMAFPEAVRMVEAKDLAAETNAGSVDFLLCYSSSLVPSS